MTKIVDMTAVELSKLNSAMSGLEHYHAAEGLLRYLDQGFPEDPANRLEVIRIAQVHATLATVRLVEVATEENNESTG
jgi:hypothetical protein